MVEHGAHMFNGPLKFNGDISAWDTSSDEDMRHMFDSADAFNGEHSRPGTLCGEDLGYMFARATTHSMDDCPDWIFVERAGR